MLTSHIASLLMDGQQARICGSLQALASVSELIPGKYFEVMCDPLAYKHNYCVLVLQGVQKQSGTNTSITATVFDCCKARIVTQPQELIAHQLQTFRGHTVSPCIQKALSAAWLSAQRSHTLHFIANDNHTSA